MMCTLCPGGTSCQNITNQEHYFAKLVDVTDAKPLYTSVPKVLKMLNECIVSETTIAIPDTSRMFYINTDWSKDGIREVLMQVYDSVEEGNPEEQEKACAKCECMSPWKECAYDIFPSYKDQQCHRCKSQGIDFW